jgi:predicted O-linked N-acetylglucosamine transferase (SPINDLY family)
VTDLRQLFQHGLALHEQGKLEAAETTYRDILANDPDYFGALYLLGVLSLQTGRTEDGIRLIERSIAINPGVAAAHHDLGNAFAGLGHFGEALQSYDKALELEPDFADANYNRGNALAELARLDEALASFDRAIALQPGHATAHCNRGNVLKDLKRFDDATISYDRAIALQPDLTLAHYNRGNVLNALKRFDEALASHDRALALAPEMDQVLDAIAQLKMAICQWDNYDELKQQLLASQPAEAGRSPAVLLAMASDPGPQRRFAEASARTFYPQIDALPALPRLARHPKIRLGYFSADFHDHATANLMAGLFEAHDRERFELSAFSFGPDKFEPMRQRLKRAFDQFIDVRSMSDREVALLARRHEIDIAIDLKGFTQNARPGIFAQRAAPIQINYLGYPGTMGTPFIDYIIADTTLIPPEHRDQYAEKVIQLPGSYQPNDRRRAISGRQFTRAELGLPAGSLVFCCFNNNYKITPSQFDSWMRILQAVQGSVLWLLEDNPAAARNLRAEAESRGVDPARLVFAQRMPLADHLARHRIADLFLDTLPFNAHTTASDALWAGLPLVTQLGRTFAGRVGASLLGAIGLPELITKSQPAYEALAIELGNNPTRLAALKRKLDANRLTTTLFDTDGFARHLEAAYGAIYERYHAGLPPDHLRLVPMS